MWMKNNKACLVGLLLLVSTISTPATPTFPSNIRSDFSTLISTGPVSADDTYPVTFPSPLTDATPKLAVFSSFTVVVYPDYRCSHSSEGRL